MLRTHTQPGYPNPTVTLHIYSLSASLSSLITITDTSASAIPEFPPSDRLITQVCWATTTHSRLLYKQTNRVQDHEKTILVSISADAAGGTDTNIETHVVREYIPVDGGWVDLAQNLRFVPPTEAVPQLRYLDVVDDGNGFMHLAMFDPVDAKEPTRFLTEGEWEVVDGSVVVDGVREIV